MLFYTQIGFRHILWHVLLVFADMGIADYFKDFANNNNKIYT